MAGNADVKAGGEPNPASDGKSRVWLYMVDGRNQQDIAILDQGFDRWRGNPNTEVGDLVLMYRTAPYSDIAFLFVAKSKAYETVPNRSFPWKHAIELGDGFRLRRVVKLNELKKDSSLEHWKFLRNQRGATSRKDDLRKQGVWRGLRNLLESIFV